jgi:hypothetical protein
MTPLMAGSGIYGKVSVLLDDKPSAKACQPGHGLAQ